MTRTKSTRRTTRRVTPISVKIKLSFFEEVLNEVMTRVYGQNLGGYSFDSSAKQQLKDSSDSFIENMWTQVKQISADSGKLEIDKSSVEEWKNRTGFQLRRRLGVSLCGLFDQVKKQHPKYVYTPRII